MKYNKQFVNEIICDFKLLTTGVFQHKYKYHIINSGSWSLVINIGCNKVLIIACEKSKQLYTGKLKHKLFPKLELITTVTKHVKSTDIDFDFYIGKKLEVMFDVAEKIYDDINDIKRQVNIYKEEELFLYMLRKYDRKIANALRELLFVLKTDNLDYNLDIRPPNILINPDNNSLVLNDIFFIRINHNFNW